jgi:hypothetical protein
MVSLPATHHFVPHRPAHADPRENFLRIRDQKLWDELEARRNSQKETTETGGK